VVELMREKIAATRKENKRLIVYSANEVFLQNLIR
jgi:hypothetical protein